MSQHKKHIIITAGGTGGHLFPAIYTAQELSKRGWNIVFITDERGAKYLVSYQQYSVKIIKSKSPFIGNIWQRFISVLNIFLSFIGLSFRCFLKRPEFILGFGGYVTTAPFMVAILLRIKFALHEQNIIMGRVNKLFAPFAVFVALSFPAKQNNRQQTMSPATMSQATMSQATMSQATNKKDFAKAKLSKIRSSKIKTIYTGLPLKPSLLKAANELKRGQAKGNIQEINILVIGGSQGAVFFADIMPRVLKQISQSLAKPIKVVHQTPKQNIKKLQKNYAEMQISADIKSFFNDLEKQYQHADLIISRAGASSVIEIALFDKLAIFIPLPYAMDDHQTFNAKFLCARGKTKIIHQPNAQQNLQEFIVKLASLSHDLLTQEQFNKKTSLKSEKEFINDADVRLAEQIEKNIK